MCLRERAILQCITGKSLNVSWEPAYVLVPLVIFAILLLVTDEAKIQFECGVVGFCTGVDPFIGRTGVTAVPRNI